MRRWVIAAGVVAVVAIAIVLGVVRGGNDEQDAQVATWQGDLADWESTTAESLVLPDGDALTDVVTGAALSVPDGSGATESLDEVNAACTRLTAFADQVQTAPGPPAPPTDVEVDAEQSAAFEDDLDALTTFQQAVSAPAATLRQFCGSYPLLITAHATEDAEEGRTQFAQALQTQCPLAELAEVCQSLAAGDAVPADQVPGVVAEQLGAAEEEIDGAASAFAQAFASA